MTWRFEIVLDGVPALVVIRDVVTEREDGLTVHQGLSIEADVHAPSEADAQALAIGLVSLHLTAMTLATRAPVDSPNLRLIYETTPGKTENLDFSQIEEVDISLGKISAPGQVVSGVQQAIMNLQDPTHGQPIILAAQMYAAALRETEPVTRFIMFWPACEALERPLRRLLTRKRKDRFWGLKALAERQGETAEFIESAYNLRTNLFHAEAGVLDGLVERTRDVGDRLEELLAPGLLMVLGLPAAVNDLPSEPSSNHPTRITFSGHLHGAHTAWGIGVHPHVILTFEAKGTGERGKGTLDAEFKVQNVETLKGPRIELRGPQGPNLGSFTMEAGSITRADGSVEIVEPTESGDSDTQDEVQDETAAT